MTIPPGKLTNRVLVIAGTSALLVGIIGVFVPVLPTTPFLLLAAICYLKGSPVLYTRLLHNRFFGAYIRNYMEGRGMSLKMKIWTLALLWAGILATTIFAVDSLLIRILLAVVLTGVTIHILLIKTLKQ